MIFINPEKKDCLKFSFKLLCFTIYRFLLVWEVLKSIGTFQCN
jgi:hypothetical protein